LRCKRLPKLFEQNEIFFFLLSPIHSHPVYDWSDHFRHNPCWVPSRVAPKVYVADLSIHIWHCKEYSFMARAKLSGNGSNRRKQTTTTTAGSLEHKQNPSTADLEAEIRRRAYELYEQRGYTPGHENEDWLVAEREVLSRAEDHQQSA
jgi:hypothetical protein